MHKLKYLVISDLDGTLLNSKGELSEKTINYIHELNKREDVLFSFATGRSWEDSEWVYKSLNLKGFIACCNGAHIYNPKKEINRYSYISENVWEICYEDKDFLNGFVSARMFTDKGMYLLNLQNKEEILKTLRERNINVFCIKFHFEKSEEKNYVNKKLAFLKKFLCNVYLVEIEEEGIFNLEIQAKYISKESFVKFMASYYEVSYENILTFGDQFNDLSMADGCSNSYAVSNALNIMKQKAKFVSLFSNDEDSVIKEVESFLNKI